MSESEGLKPLTLDEFNRGCFIEFSSAVDVASLASLVRVKSRHPLWNGRVARHACQMLVLLTEPRALS